MSETDCGPFPGDSSSDNAPHFHDSLVAARTGNQSAIGQLLETYRGYLLAIAEAELPEPLAGKVGASDLVQDTICKGLQHFPDFRGSTRQELARWLRRILLNDLDNLRDAFAAQKRDVAREQRATADVADPFQTSPSGQALSTEERERLEAALARLPDEARQVILLRHRDNLTFAEIGAAIGKSEEAARKIWARAIEKLHKELT